MNVDQFLELLMLGSWVVALVILIFPTILGASTYGWWGAFKRRLGLRLLIAVTIVVIFTFISAAVIFIQPTRVGMKITALRATGFDDDPYESGLHFAIPLLEQIVEYPISEQTYTMSYAPTEGSSTGNDAILVRTSDGLTVFIDTSIIFAVDKQRVSQLHIKWQDRYITDYIRPLIRGLVRTELTAYTVDELLGPQRLEIQDMLSTILNEKLLEQHLVMNQFLLRNVTFSPEFDQALEDKEIAAQRIVQSESNAESVRKLAAGDADRIRIIANAEAEAIKIKAQAQADALELIAAVLEGNDDLLTFEYINQLSPNIRALVVPQENPLLLPLNDLVPSEEQFQAGATTESGLLDTLVPSVTPTPTPTPTPTGATDDE